MRIGSSVGAAVLVVWLLIGTLAAVQRGYFDSGDDASCASLGTTAVAIVAGPLNYFGMNPKLQCEAPQPSK